jgi:hypothetical protein
VIFFRARMTLRYSWEDNANLTSGDYPVKRRRWSAQEIQMLQARYSDEGPNDLAQEMGRSADSVSSFAHRCGLRTRRWLERREADTAETEPVGATYNA